MNSPEVCYKVFSLLSGCEISRAGATCKLWHSISVDDSLWKHLFAFYVGKKLFDKPITLEPGQWKKIFITCFGSCDSGYTSFYGFKKILDELHEKENAWDVLALRNRVRHIWQKRFMPSVYNMSDPTPTYFNTDLFADFPLCLNFLSHTLQGKRSSTDAKGILFNRSCPSRFAEVCFHYIESEIPDQKLHVSATLIDLEKKTQEFVPIMDCTMSFDGPFVFSLDMSPGDFIFNSLQDEYGNVAEDICYDREALQRLLKHVNWDVEKASKKFHTTLTSLGEPPHNALNEEVAEHEFLATLFTLAISTNLNRLRGEYFKKNEGNVYQHMLLFYAISEPGAETTEIWDLLLYSILQQKAEGKVDEALRAHTRWANDEILKSEIKTIAEEMQIFLQYTKWLPGEYNGTYRAERKKVIKLFKTEEIEIGEEEVDYGELDSSQLDFVLEEKKGYIILSEKVKGDMATIEIKIVTPRGNCILAIFTAATSGGVEVMMGPIDVLLKHLTPTTKVSGQDLLEIISIYGDAYTSVSQILNTRRHAAATHDESQGAAKKRKTSDQADIMRDIMDKWTKEEKKKEPFVGKPSSLSIF
eukprot:Phypoly_transcript_06030.p1 GENE.Phypoly_transcript_06030~~Phypoly_transcript_06030.p1  ORF type:complete len:600 (+),score=104.81 Phypoly_transcript_06030:48-1802(+)